MLCRSGGHVRAAAPGTGGAALPPGVRARRRGAELARAGGAAGGGGGAEPANGALPAGGGAPAGRAARGADQLGRPQAGAQINR